MQPIVITASPLAYAECKKVIFVDLRTRHPFLYIGLPIIVFIPLIFIAVMVAGEGFAAIAMAKHTDFGTACDGTTVRPVL